MKKLTKKWLILLLAIVSALCLVLGLAACGGGDDEDDTNNPGNGDTTNPPSGKITLAAPVITLEGNVISWNAVENASRYYVYLGNETGSEGEATVNTSYEIKVTEPGEYVYTVAAYNKDAEPQYSSKSNAVTYKVSNGEEITLTAPVIELVDNLITWDAVAHAEYYLVYEGDAETGIQVESTSYAINKTEDGEYTYTVTAYNSEADPPESEKSNAVTYKKETLGEEFSLDAPVIELNSNLISWDAVERASYYIVYEGDAEEGERVSGTSYMIEKDVPGEYTYTVTAYNSNATPNESAKSNAVTYVVEEPPVPQLNAPILDIQGNALNWTEVTGAVAYDIYKNGELFDTVEAIDFYGVDKILPTTYTLSDVANGDKFTVVAVAGESEEGYENSEHSEEVAYVASATTLNATNEVYILDTTDSISVSVSGLQKVIIRLNNNLHNFGEYGDEPVNKFEIRGIAAEDAIGAEYIAEAVYDDGAYVATLAINASDLKLYFDITTSFGALNLTLGFTVSLEQPYDFTNDNGLKVTDTYTLNATDSTEAEIPYTGYWIKLEFDDSVPATGNALYVVLENNASVAEGLVVRINGTDAGLISNETSSGVYYVTAGVFAKSSAVYLASRSTGSKATISLKAPDVVVESSPALEVDEPEYSVRIGHKATPSVYRIAEPGDYVLVINAYTSGFKFYIQSDNFNSSATGTPFTEVVNVYSLNIHTATANQIIYVYEFTSNSDNKEGVDVSWIGLFETGTLSYDLSEEKDAENALLGGDLASATTFNLKNVENGDYTLTITASGSGLTFEVVVGEQNYTISNGVNKFPDYIYSTEISIEDADSILIYVTNGVYIANVSIKLIVEEDLPELTHGGAGLKFTFTAQYGDLTDFTFKLVDVTAGKYRVALTGFGSYEDYVDLKVIVGDGLPTAICDVTDGYKGPLTINITNETTLTFRISGLHGSLKWTIYLLAEGEEIEEGGGGGTGGSETSASISVSLNWGYGPQEIDVSSLQYGIYTITLEGDSDNLDGQGYVSTATEEDLVLNSDNSYTQTITISSDSIYLNGMGQFGTITVKLTKTGDLPGASGGTATELTIEFGDNNQIESVLTTLDVSSLQYGEYTVTLENVYNDWLNGYAPYSINDIDLNEGNNWTITLTIDSDTVSLFTTATYEPLTIKFVKVG